MCVYAELARVWVSIRARIICNRCKDVYIYIYTHTYTYIYIYIYTYKTTLRVIRRLWGEGAQRFATSTHTSIAHRTIIVFTSSLHRYHINIASNIKFTTISYHYPINIATSSQRQHISITSMSHQYHIELLSNIADITPI